MYMKEKRKFEMPHTFVIILAIIVVAVILTWIIPAGEYVRFEDARGVEVIDPQQFSYVPRTPVNPGLIPMYIVNAFMDNIDLLLVILFSAELTTYNAAEIWRVLNDNIQSAVVGDATPQEALTAAQEQATEILAEYQ